MAKKVRRVRSNRKNTGLFHSDTTNMVAFIAILFLLLTIVLSMMVVWYRVGAPINAAGI